MQFWKITFVLACCLMAGQQARGQKSPVLENYIAQGLRSNLSLQQQTLDWQQSLAAVQEARSLFYPTLQFNATYTRAAGGRKIDLPIGDLLNPVYGTLNQLTQSNNFPSIDNQSIQFLPDNFQETYVRFGVPVFNSDIRGNRKLKVQLAAGKEASKEAYETSLRYEITIAYYQYLQSLEAANVLKDAESVLHDLQRFNESLVRNQVATRDILSSAAYELSQIEQQQAAVNAASETAKSYFNFLINRPLNTEITPDSSLLQIPPATFQADSLIDLAWLNRKELTALDHACEVAATAVEIQENRLYLPEVFIGGQFGFQGYGYQFDKDQLFALAQIGLKYNLYSGGQNKIALQSAKLKTLEIEAKKAETHQLIALQTSQAWQNLEASKAGYFSAEKGLVAAEERFRIINNKYRNGQALFLEWSDAQNKVSSARLQCSVQKLKILQAEAALQQAIGQ